MITQEIPGQLIVLGGGLTPEGGPTEETAERAITAAHYALDNGVSRVVFSGGESLLVSGNGSGTFEADVMADIAVSKGLDSDYITGLDRNSRSTFETFLNVQKYLANVNTGIVTHAYHMRRALYMGELTLPAIDFTGIEAMAKYNAKAKPPLNERLLLTVTRLAMMNVEEGDTETLRARNNMVVRVVGTPGRLKLLSATLLKNHTSVKALKAHVDKDETVSAGK